MVLLFNVKARRLGWFDLRDPRTRYRVFDPEVWGPHGVVNPLTLRFWPYTPLWFPGATAGAAWAEVLRDAKERGTLEVTSGE